MTRLLPVLLLLLASCSGADLRVEEGTLDLRSYLWARGPVNLAGMWDFDSGRRAVPDAWEGSGSGTYRVRILLPPDSPRLALRYGTASTAFRIKANGEELVSVGHPDADPTRAVSAYAPGTVTLPGSPVLDVEIFVSNHVYRVGGLWETPVLGPETAVEQDRWYEEAGSVALAAALAIIGFSTLLLFAVRRTGKTFLHLGIFAFLIALRSLVTGEYALVRMVPGIPFEVLIRLEYLTAFLPFPAAVLFFTEFFPGLLARWAVRCMTWPSWAFALLSVTLPLDLLTRSILWFYPFAVPALLVGTFLLVRRILVDRQGALLLVGAGVLAGTGLADMATAAFFATTGTFVPWGLGLFVILQATTLARRFLAAFDATEALLAEKELLVKEVHHRVKNSLQVVASLVSLQSHRTGDAAQKAIYHALRQRITVIALVHEKLYGQRLGGRPDLGEYLSDLLKLQHPGDNLGPEGVRWAVDADPVAAGVDYCIDAGLVLTELVGNAVKHGTGGRVEVSLRIREKLEIEVRDSGPGFPPEFTAATSAGLGFRIVLSLLQRNEGELTILPGPGGRVRVELRLPPAG